MKLTLEQLKQGLADLHRVRQHVLQIEKNLMQDVGEYLKAKGGVRYVARRTGFSPGYISDVRHGRRKISDEFLKRLERLDSSGHSSQSATRIAPHGKSTTYKES